MIWQTALVVINVAIGSLAAFKLAVWHTWFNAVERYALGLLGAGSVMTIGPILISNGPFDQWAPLLRAAGVLLLMVGHILRYRKTGVSR